jgi:hypothetical protein
VPVLASRPSRFWADEQSAPADLLDRLADDIAAITDKLPAGGEART